MKPKDDGFLALETVQEEHWRGMPEFVQKKHEPYQTVTINFRTEADVRLFARITGLKIGPTFCSVWYPQNKKTENGMKVYRDALTPKKRGRRTK